MTDSSMQQFIKLMEANAQYVEKKQQLEDWKLRFQQLEQDITELITFFEHQYELSEVGDEFIEGVKERLENRRDGIRLSVKSAGRLLRRLAPEKPLDQGVPEFISREMIIAKLQSSLPKNKESHTVIDENMEAIESTSKAHNEVEMPIDEAGTVLDISHLFQEAMDNNHTTIQMLDEYIEGAEKRFFVFIEKGVAPVLDGLYSGDKYATELVSELLAENYDQITRVKEWLKIYSVLMRQIKDFLQKFSIGLFSPEIGDVFDENKHEPIGVVEDSYFEDEQIKEVVRYGLTYDMVALQTGTFYIRPAQVIVVKNRKSTTVEEQRGNQHED